MELLAKRLGTEIILQNLAVDTGLAVSFCSVSVTNSSHVVMVLKDGKIVVMKYCERIVCERVHLS